MLNAAGPLFLLLFRNAVVSDDVRSLFQNILLVSCLPWVIVVDHIRHTVYISTVRHYADMSFEDHNITALPLFRIFPLLIDTTFQSLFVHCTRNMRQKFRKQFRQQKTLQNFF